MKKLVLILLLGLVLAGLVLAKAEVSRNTEQNGNTITVTTEVQNKNVEIIRTRTITRNCDGNNCTGEMQITVQKTKDNETIIRSKNVSVITNWDIEINDSDNETYADFIGYKKQIKIMPDTASERALERLRLKVCNESNNCTIQLKDVSNNQTELRYELQIERHYRLLGMFKTKAQVKAEIGAESGNVTITKKPWWAFLAASSDN